MSAPGSDATGNVTPSVWMKDLAVEVLSKLSTPMTRIRASAPPAWSCLRTAAASGGSSCVAARAPGAEEQQDGRRAVATPVGRDRHLGRPGRADVGAVKDGTGPP